MKNPRKSTRMSPRDEFILLVADQCLVHARPSLDDLERFARIVLQHILSGKAITSPSTARAMRLRQRDQMIVQAALALPGMTIARCAETLSMLARGLGAQQYIEAKAWLEKADEIERVPRGKDQIRNIIDGPLSHGMKSRENSTSGNSKR